MSGCSATNCARATPCSSVNVLSYDTAMVGVSLTSTCSDIALTCLPSKPRILAIFAPKAFAVPVLIMLAIKLLTQKYAGFHLLQRVVPCIIWVGKRPAHLHVAHPAAPDHRRLDVPAIGAVHQPGHTISALHSHRGLHPAHAVLGLQEPGCHKHPSEESNLLFGLTWM